MTKLTLTCKTSNFEPHPEGVHSALCVDVLDLGLVETEYQGVKKKVNKVRLTFESEAKTADGKNFTVSKSFNASLHPKAKLSGFVGGWRGRPVVDGESIDLQKLIGACCTLVISHQQSLSGNQYASVDAISKPTKKLVASGHYDPLAARQRHADWLAKQSPTSQVNPPAPVASVAPATTPAAADDNYDDVPF